MGEKVGERIALACVGGGQSLEQRVIGHSVQREVLHDEP
jgi:hypothetical protein